MITRVSPVSQSVFRFLLNNWCLRSAESISENNLREFCAVPFQPVGRMAVRVSQKTREMLNGALAKANRSLLPRDGYKKALGESGRDIAGWWRARDRRWFLGSTDITRVRRYYADNDGLADSIIGLADRVLER